MPIICSRSKRRSSVMPALNHSLHRFSPACLGKNLEVALPSSPEGAEALPSSYPEEVHPSSQAGEHPSCQGGDHQGKAEALQAFPETESNIMEFQLPRVMPVLSGLKAMRSPVQAASILVGALQEMTAVQRSIVRRRHTETTISRAILPLAAEALSEALQAVLVEGHWLGDLWRRSAGIDLVIQQQGRGHGYTWPRHWASGSLVSGHGHGAWLYM